MASAHSYHLQSPPNRQPTPFPNPGWMREHEYHMNNSQTNPVPGQKRRASDDLERQSAISSSFKKLRLNHVPPAPLHAKPVGVTFRNDSDPNTSPTKSDWAGKNQDISPRSQPQPLSYQNNAHHDDYEYMPIDDTPNRIIIHDLDAEIASIEAEEKAQAKEEAARHQQEEQSQQQKPSHTNDHYNYRTNRRNNHEQGTISFPDEIDKQISAIPQSVLKHQPYRPEDTLSNNTALVLYRDPTSLSVPEEEDAVRKTIVAARQRVRERQGLVDVNANANSQPDRTETVWSKEWNGDGRGDLVNEHVDPETDMNIEDDGRYNPPRHDEEDEYDPDAMEIE